MCEMIKCSKLIKHNILSGASASVYNVLLSGIKEHRQLVISLNHGPSQ